MGRIKRGAFHSSCLLIILAGLMVGTVRAQGTRLARTPPMGWDGWSAYYAGITTDATVRAEAHAMATDGLKAAGYRYVILDEGWEGTRDAQGEIRPNRYFPDMKGLSDYIHSLGLKFGLYSSPGPYTCHGYIGSYRHEMQDARIFASWGADYLKYDYCTASLAYGNSPDQMRAADRKMYEALRSTGRPIVFSLYETDLGQVWRWGLSAGANMWLTAEAIPPGRSQVYMRVGDIGFEQNGLDKYVGPGHWNNPGILEIGNGRMTQEEEKLQMSLWSILAAPLLTGNDLRTMTPQTLATLTNREVIAVDQDREGIEGRRVAEEGQLEVWMKPLSDGSKAVGLFNREEGDAPITVNFSDIGIHGAAKVRDLWEHKDLGIYRGSFSATVPSHGVVMIKVTPQQEP
ncbi:MAG: glycoside hydrolase family 27 protein [Terriglobia bacterium]